MLIYIVLLLAGGLHAQSSTVVDPRLDQRWMIVNDGVMGGLSQSSVFRHENVYRFSGYLSLGNNGGFASTRFLTPKGNLSAFDGIRIRVRGDGRTYRIQLRSRRRYNGIAYQADFRTRDDEWTEITVPFTKMIPVWRGRYVRGAKPLDRSSIRQVGFMIADGRAGPFQLDIEQVAAYRD
jgi:NADH dehydrogenase [ubiquinone] 1 alpha subcomplex assembly factor 1